MNRDMPSGFFDAVPIIVRDPRERELALMMRRSSSTVVLPVPTTMWGFFYNSCIHESAPALESLHITRRGAFKAMLAHRYREWETALHPDREDVYGMHWSAFRAHRDAYEEARRMNEYSARFIAPIPVHPS